MKQLTCIICPAGCRITVDKLNGNYSFLGNKCARGWEFAQTELTSPLRSLTTTVRTAFPDMPVLPVRTNKEAPKEKIMEIIRALSKVTVTKRISIGETVVANVLETGCDIIAASDMLRGNL